MGVALRKVQERCTGVTDKHDQKYMYTVEPFTECIRPSASDIVIRRKTVPRG